MNLKFVLLILIPILLYLHFNNNNNNIKHRLNKNYLLNNYNFVNDNNNKNNYKIDIIRKDTMGGNFKDEYLHYNGKDLDKPYTAWTDEKSFSSPNYYNRALNGYKIGSELHYDDANKLHINSETLKNPVKKYPSSKCYIDVNNVNVCDFRGKHKKVPYSLFNVNDNGDPVYKNIVSEGIDKVNNENRKTLNYQYDKVENGGPFLKGSNNLIYASVPQNEKNGSSLNEQIVVFN